MIIEGTIKRQVDPGNGKSEVEIPFLIDTETGTYSQWGHDQPVLGANVDFMCALRNAACEAAADEDADDTMGDL
ncbi:hypothetical protein [Mycolicibacterium sp.]|uniref:hypothetical protein n=1 Tax=Mycolicibacterium sp. TaxID=2320850 RepID=UPI0037C9CA18